MPMCFKCGQSYHLLPDSASSPLIYIRSLTQVLMPCSAFLRYQGILPGLCCNPPSFLICDLTQEFLTSRFWDLWSSLLKPHCIRLTSHFTCHYFECFLNTYLLKLVMCIMLWSPTCHCTSHFGDFKVNPLRYLLKLAICECDQVPPSPHISIWWT